MNVLHCQYENALFIYPHTTHVVPNPYAFILFLQKVKLGQIIEAPAKKHLDSRPFNLCTIQFFWRQTYM